MLGILYLLSIFIIGYYLMLKFTPWFEPSTLGRQGGDEGEKDEKARSPAWMFQLPFAWVLGALVVNWTNFALCDYNRSIGSTLFTLGLAATAAGWILLTEYQDKENSRFIASLRNLWAGTGAAELIYLAIALALAAYTNLYTLTETPKEVLVSNGVWSDFSPHISLIRSFSVGDNFPPQYPHFAAGDIPYHFLFHFLASSLEFLGLPLSWAFNAPSIISLLSLLLLIYVLAVRITRSKWVGTWAMIFIFFRSSWAFFQYAQNFHWRQLPTAILETDFYVGKTPNAAWGMWTLFNTFANQRHLAFSICALLISLILMYPLVEAKLFGQAADNQAQKWRMGSMQRAVFVGCFLGAIAFWNGAMLMAALMVLAGFTLTSRHRLEYLLIAAISVVFASIQGRWFVSPDHAPIHLTFHFGFLAADNSLTGTASYILQAYGILVPLFLLTIWYWRKYAMVGLAFALPFIFSFTVQPTIDIALNHKFVLVSEFLMGIFVAWMLVDAWRHKAKIWRIAIVPAFVLLTITGTVDLAAFHNINGGRIGIIKANPVTKWVMANTPKRSIFLTDLTTIDPILFAGRLSYLGWPYYGWGAGYDTKGREEDIRKIYGAGSADDLKRALKNTTINYILVNNSVRNAPNYVINEGLIAATYPLVFADPYEDTKIYKVSP